MGDRSLPAAAADRDWTRLRRHGGFAICAFLGENAGANGVSGGQLDLQETRFPSAVSNIRLSKITDEEQLSAYYRHASSMHALLASWRAEDEGRLAVGSLHVKEIQRSH
jgi:hypothetical protein